jgi:hypothetical protein
MIDDQDAGRLPRTTTDGGGADPGFREGEDGETNKDIRSRVIVHPLPPGFVVGQQGSGADPAIPATWLQQVEHTPGPEEKAIVRRTASKLVELFSGIARERGIAGRHRLNSVTKGWIANDGVEAATIVEYLGKFKRPVKRPRLRE